MPNTIGHFPVEVDVHVPHGYRHMSEFSHALIGVEAGRRLLAASA